MAMVQKSQQIRSRFDSAMWDGSSTISRADLDCLTEQRKTIPYSPERCRRMPGISSLRLTFIQLSGLLPECDASSHASRNEYAYKASISDDIPMDGCTVKALQLSQKTLKVKLMVSPFDIFRGLSPTR